MIKNTINEDEAFEINPDYLDEVKVEDFDGVRVVVVDNFYKNPHLVRQLALDIPASRNKRIRGMNPAWRINAFYDMDSMSWVFDQLARRFFNKEMQTLPMDYMQQSFMNATFMVNVMQTENLPPLVPHMDNPAGNHLAATIYLNTANECNGGTSFYKYGGKTYYDDPHTMKTLDVAGNVQVNEYVTDSIGDFEMIGMVPMVFNRMVLYNQSVLHTAYVKENMFVGDNYRLNQQFFI